MNRGNRKLATQTRWCRSGIGCTDVLGFGMGLSEFGNQWDRVEFLGSTDFHDRLGQTFVEEFVGLFGDYHLCTWSILYTNSTLPPFNSIGFPMDSK